MPATSWRRPDRRKRKSPYWMRIGKPWVGSSVLKTDRDDFTPPPLEEGEGTGVRGLGITRGHYPSHPNPLPSKRGRGGWLNLITHGGARWSAVSIKGLIASCTAYANFNESSCKS